jgi:glycerol-3-phosphate dehydrogenase (NAD(P)+)
VIGAGSYGTCLALLLHNKGHEVALWCRDQKSAAELKSKRENHKYLPGFLLPEAILISADLKEVVSNRDFVLGTTPSHAIRQVFAELAPHLTKNAIVVNASKGLEEGTLHRIDQMYDEILPKPVAARACFLSGPTFAQEVAKGLPAAIVIAGDDQKSVAAVQDAFSTDTFRVYSSDDVIGVELGGALKNIYAICAGISDGLGFGDNARAGLITRGLAEMSRIGKKLGADELTFSGLSGMGDLVLTCTGGLSRNRQVGLALGQGKKLAAIISDMQGMVAEGVKTTRAARELAHNIGVEAPLCEYAYQVMYEDRPAREGIRDLMKRSRKAERD